MTPSNEVDILESDLRRLGDLLDILLKDRTTGKNILWATDSYQSHGRKAFMPKKSMLPDQVTGIYNKIIQPRALKSLAEQKRRTKEKAEVFTPLRIVEQMNKLVDWGNQNKYISVSNWKDYIKELKLEITCGEAPYIVSRYNPTAHTGKLIKIENRVGFLDKKLQVVSRYCDDPDSWLIWAKEAYRASYGYEWQGDNILIARENLLYTLIDYFQAKFNRKPSVKVLKEFATIISWNVFQMDGLRYVVPMSCRHRTEIMPGELMLFDEIPETIRKYVCEGCKFNQPTRHNGKYVKIMDWSKNKPIKFISLLTS